MAVNINIPSQVKTYANLAAFPASGALKTIYIAEDTNKTYRWTGSIYTEISASAAMTWGAIGGTLSNQTDLQNALDAKVPTSRTLTINGVTQDLSADRTFTISTGITIGSTAITSGVVGRVLFEGAGNVVQESSSLFWDATNNRLGIGTSSPSFGLDVNGTTRISGALTIASGSVNTPSNTNSLGVFGGSAFNNGSYFAVFGNNCSTSNGVQQGSIQIFTDRSTSELNGGTYQVGSHSAGSAFNFNQIVFKSGNTWIGNQSSATFPTDAGYRLDVNGTARVQNDVLLTTGILATSAGTTRLQSSLNYFTHNRLSSSGVFGFQIATLNNVASFWRWDGATGDTEIGGNGYLGAGALKLYTNNAERMRIFYGGNVLINTTTDAGYRLDVNGTARVSGNTRIVGSLLISSYLAGSGVAGSTFSIYGSDSDTNGQQLFVSANGIWQGSTTLNASACAQFTSTTRGFLPPRMTTTQKNAIATPAAGLMVYDTTLNVISYYNGTMWI